MRGLWTTPGEHSRNEPDGVGSEPNGLLDTVLSSNLLLIGFGSELTAMGLEPQ